MYGYDMRNNWTIWLNEARTLELGTVDALRGVRARARPAPIAPTVRPPISSLSIQTGSSRQSFARTDFESSGRVCYHLVMPEPYEFVEVDGVLWPHVEWDALDPASLPPVTEEDAARIQACIKAWRCENPDAKVLGVRIVDESNAVLDVARVSANFPARIVSTLSVRQGQTPLT